MQLFQLHKSQYEFRQGIPRECQVFLLSFFLPAAHRCAAGDLPFNSAQVVSQEVFECFS